MMEQIIIAGFGGQGVLSMGKMLAEAGMVEDKNVSWLPSYGPEMRGGTANCNVIISDTWVGSPVVTQGTAVIVMNRPSLELFEQNVAPGGMLFVNSSLIDIVATRDDIQVFYVPVNEIAEELGNSKVANMVMLGAYLGKNPVVSVETVLDQLKEVLGPGKAHLIPLNRSAIERGAAAVNSIA